MSDLIERLKSLRYYLERTIGPEREYYVRLATVDEAIASLESHKPRLPAGWGVYHLADHILLREAGPNGQDSTISPDTPLGRFLSAFPDPDESAPIEPVKAASDTAGELPDDLVEVLRFLNGEAPLEVVNGYEVWFGDSPNSKMGPYWWRKRLRPYLSPATPPDHLDVQKVADESKAPKESLAETMCRIGGMRDLEHWFEDGGTTRHALVWLIQELDRRLDQGRE